eukprot:s1130_g11.t1
MFLDPFGCHSAQPRNDFTNGPCALSVLCGTSMVWVRTLQPLRCGCRHLAIVARNASVKCHGRCPAPSRAHGKAFLPLGAGGLSLLLSSGHLLLEEEEDEDEEEEDFTVHSWNKCQPGMQSSASRVFVWGNRACWPGTNDRVPETNVQWPTEVPWFAQFAEQNNCKWQQLSFGPSFGVSRTDSGEA